MTGGMSGRIYSFKEKFRSHFLNKNEASDIFIYYHIGVISKKNPM